MKAAVRIARLVGPVLTATGIGMVANRSLYAGMVAAAVNIPTLVLLSGLLVLTAGIAMLNGYHTWTSDWRAIVTVLGWLFVIAGIIRIVLPTVACPSQPRFIRGRCPLQVLELSSSRCKAARFGVFASPRQYESTQQHGGDRLAQIGKRAFYRPRSICLGAIGARRRHRDNRYRCTTAYARGVAADFSPGHQEPHQC